MVIKKRKKQENIVKNEEILVSTIKVTRTTRRLNQLLVFIGDGRDSSI